MGEFVLTPTVTRVKLRSMSSPYIPPKFKTAAFNCPYCNAFAAQTWQHLYPLFRQSHPMENESRRFWMSSCSHCRAVSTWYDERLLVPDTSAAPMPHGDMPGSCKPDFDEARSVLQRSPRAAAALLRLCLQRLCIELGKPRDRRKVTQPEDQHNLVRT
jgi:hypothetical protein